MFPYVWLFVDQATYLVPNVQVLREGVSSSRARPIVCDSEDILAIEIHAIYNNHGGQIL